MADNADRPLGLFGRFARQADRYAHILKYHHPSQLARRLAKRVWEPIESRIPKLFSRAEVPPLRNRNQTAYKFLEIIRIAVATGAEDQAAKNNIANLMQGRITLLNREAELGWPFDWRLSNWPDAPPLWAFQLHYHEYLLDIVRHDLRLQTQKTVWSLIENWIDQHPRSYRLRRKLAFHPYCISRRIPVWCWLLVAARPEEAVLTKVTRSLAEQMRHLESHLETDIGGNHLWENARALAIGGSFFSGPVADRWRTNGIKLLRTCVTEQLSPKGEHFERSPMYQADLARGLRELVHWLNPVEGCHARCFAAVAERMTTFLDAIRHPDGEIPLFGDSVINHVREESSMIANIRRPKQSYWAGDYFIHEQDEHKLIFDAGNIGPDHLPAHAHADLLGFEMSLFGQRIMVDSGTFCYTGPKRSEFRESRAHNVLIVDDIELADVWSSFRMGRRGHVRGRWSGKTPLGHWVAASHDAYRSIGLDRVLRIWFFANTAMGPWFSIHVAQGPSTNKHEFCEYLHFHPNAIAGYDQATDTLSAQTATKEAKPIRRWTCEKASRELEIDRMEGSYSPTFYREEATRVFGLRQTARLPVLSAWAVHFNQGLIKPQVTLNRDVITITWRVGKKLQKTKFLLPASASS